MPNRKTLFALAALLACLPGTASAALDKLEESLELALSQVQLPYSEVSRLVARPCADCDRIQLTVNTSTRYYIGSNPQPVPFAEFSKAAKALEDGLLFVFYEPGGDVVTRIVLGG